MARKVLYTASTYSHLRNFHRPYLERFREAGWTVHTAASGEPGELPEAHRTWSLPFAKRMTAPSNFGCAAALGRLMAREDYELVVANTSLAAFFTRLPLLGRRRRPKVVHLVHGYLFDGHTPALKRQILLNAERLAAPCTDLVLTMNETDFEIATAHRLGRRVIPVPGMGVPFGRVDAAGREEGARFRAALGVPADAFLMVYPAEFSARKNQAVLLRALARLPARAWLLLPGAGAELDACQKLARALGVADRVRFPGHLPDVPVCLRGADCAVSSSRSEGLPFHIMEAMRAGLPVLASDVKGHRDLLQGGVGVLYPYGDEAAFAAAARLLMDDADYCAKLGRTARAASEQYSLERVLPQVMGALNTLLPLSAEEAAPV